MTTISRSVCHGDLRAGDLGLRQDRLRRSDVPRNAHRLGAASETSRGLARPVEAVAEEEIISCPCPGRRSAGLGRRGRLRGDGRTTCGTPLREVVQEFTERRRPADHLVRDVADVDCLTSPKKTCLARVARLPASGSLSACRVQTDPAGTARTTASSSRSLFARDCWHGAHRSMRADQRRSGPHVRRRLYAPPLGVGRLKVRGRRTAVVREGAGVGGGERRPCGPAHLPGPGQPRTPAHAALDRAPAGGRGPRLFRQEPRRPAGRGPPAASRSPHGRRTAPSPAGVAGVGDPRRSVAEPDDRTGEGRTLTPVRPGPYCRGRPRGLVRDRARGQRQGGALARAGPRRSGGGRHGPSPSTRGSRPAPR